MKFKRGTIVALRADLTQTMTVIGESGTPGRLECEWRNAEGKRFQGAFAEASLEDLKSFEYATGDRSTARR
jgi:hypothetical protein